MHKLTTLALGVLFAFGGGHSALSQDSPMINAIDACLLSEDSDSAIARFEAMAYRPPTGQRLELVGSYFAYGQRVRAYIERGQLPVPERLEQEQQVYVGAVEGFGIEGSPATLLTHADADDHFVIINTIPQTCGVVQYARSPAASIAGFGFGPNATLPSGLDAPVAGPLWTDTVLPPSEDTMNALLRRKVPQDGADQTFPPAYTISEWSLRY